MDRLKRERLKGSTRRTYYAVWKSFNEFFLKLDSKPLSWEKRLVLFVGYLVDKKRKSTTIKSYISAIKSTLADIDVRISEDRFLLSSLIRACKLNNDIIIHKFPIHLQLVESLLKTVKAMLEEKGQHYLATLYQAIFCAAYYGLFRIGELTLGVNEEHAVKAKNVHRICVGEKTFYCLKDAMKGNNGDFPKCFQ